MPRVQFCSAALLLSACATAWADGEMYPPMPIADGVSTVTRAQVKAELREAIRLGLIVNGEHDFPTITPAQGRMIAVAGRRAAGHDVVSRGEVIEDPGDVVVVWGDPRVLRVKIQAEASEANRLGLLSFGEGDPPIATAEQERQIAAAGRRALDALRVAEHVARAPAR